MGDEYGADENLEQDLVYQAELVKLAIAELLVNRMEETNVSRTELARKMNVSRARVTQILAGYANLTVSTMTAAAAALDAKLYVELIPMASCRTATLPESEGGSTPPRPGRTPGKRTATHSPRRGGATAAESRAPR